MAFKTNDPLEVVEHSFTSSGGQSRAESLRRSRSVDPPVVLLLSPCSSQSRLLLIRRGERARGADGALSGAPQRRPVASGDGRAQREGGRPPAGPDAPGGSTGTRAGTHQARAVQPALRG